MRRWRRSKNRSCTRTWTAATKQRPTTAGRCAAELAEWQRVVQLLASTGDPYDPDTDVVVQEKLAGGRRREEAEQQRRQEQQRVADRASEPLALAGSGRLDWSVASRPGDEAARALLDDYDYRVPAVDDWFAHALANRAGHYANPVARAAAVGSLPVSGRPRAALLATLARTGTPNRRRPRVRRAATPRPTRTPRTPSPRGWRPRPQ